MNLSRRLVKNLCQTVWHGIQAVSSSGPSRSRPHCSANQVSNQIAATQASEGYHPTRESSLALLSSVNPDPFEKGGTKSCQDRGHHKSLIRDPFPVSLICSFAQVKERWYNDCGIAPIARAMDKGSESSVAKQGGAIRACSSTVELLCMVTKSCEASLTLATGKCYVYVMICPPHSLSKIFQIL